MTLELRDVTVKVGKAVLLDAVSIAVQPGKVTIILGPNGAGKSTLLAVLAGDMAPTAGHVPLDGVPLANFSQQALAARRAVVGQHAPMSFPLQVHEIVALSHMSAGNGPNDETVEDAMAKLDILHLAARDYTTLSGGERQRVQLARALAQLSGQQGSGDPSYLLLDEPTAHLDLKHQIQALEIAQNFAETGGGVFCILHDIGLAREFADHVVLLKNGCVLSQGHPNSELTAQHIAALFDISEARTQQLDLGV